MTDYLPRYHLTHTSWMEDGIEQHSWILSDSFTLKDIHDFDDYYEAVRVCRELNREEEEKYGTAKQS